MALSPGTRLEQFEIAELVGVGGMGEEYRATDSKLGRHVAIQFLQEVSSRLQERLAPSENEENLRLALNYTRMG